MTVGARRQRAQHHGHHEGGGDRQQHRPRQAERGDQQDEEYAEDRELGGSLPRAGLGRERQQMFGSQGDRRPISSSGSAEGPV